MRIILSKNINLIILSKVKLLLTGFYYAKKKGTASSQDSRRIVAG